MTSRPVRLARGAVTASFSAFVAAFAHGVGGGQFPPLALLALAAVFSVLVCTALAGRSVSWFRLAASVAFSQVVFHLIFSVSTLSVVPRAVDAPHHHGAALPVMGSGAAQEAGDHSSMVLAHVFAAAITVVALRFGETAFWGLLRTVVLAISSLVRMPRYVGDSLPPRRSADASDDTTVRRALSATLIVSRPFRGPPSMPQHAVL